MMQTSTVSAADANKSQSEASGGDRSAMLHQQQYGVAQQMQLQQQQQPVHQSALDMQLQEPQTELSLRAIQHEQSAPRRWVKYYIQRVTTNVNHVLFYVVDEAGMGKLAVVGTDVKLSGHFVYASVNDMTGAPGLRCTNRQKVLEWLSDLGAAELAEDHEVTLPQLSPQHWQQLHSSNHMMLRPRLDRNYSNWREDSGRLPDGRHFKHYFLVDSTSSKEFLAIIGEDTARLDRRYTYKAVEEVGGFCFENAKAVTEWLDFLVGRAAGPPVMARRDMPPDRKRSKKKRRCPDFAAPGDAEGLGQGTLLFSNSGRVVNHPTHTSMAGLPVASDSQRLDAGALALPIDTIHTLGGSAGIVPGGHPFAAPLPYEQFQLGTPLQFSLTAAQQPLSRFGAGLLGPVTPGCTQGAVDGGAPARAADMTVDMEAAVRAAGEEVRQLFEVGGQQLLHFVTHVPDQESTDIMSEMSRRLSSFVQALGLTGMPGASSVDPAEVLSILQFLAARPAGLKLLEQTGIGRPVALLGCMHDVLAAQGQQLRPDAEVLLQPVHELARQLAILWQDLAATAHKLASEALKASSTPL